MKRKTAFFTCLALLFMLLQSCAGQTSPGDVSPGGTSSDDISDQISHLSETEGAVSAERSGTPEEPGNPQTERLWPYVTGTFIQLWAFTSYNETKWEKHCGYLLEAGIDTVIVQWSCSSKDNKLCDAYYPSTLETQKGPGYAETRLLDALLKVCEKKGMRVFIGLNNPAEWFQNVFSRWDWCEAEADLSLKVARDLYDLYQKKYPNAFYGWYFVPEYYNGMGDPEKAAKYLNLYLDGLTAIDPGLPLMLSPFLRASVSPEDTRAEWTSIFAKTRFRAGDIFACQDSVGAGGIALSQMDAYFEGLYAASQTKKELLFWANNENFTVTGTPAPLDRFVMQMEIAAKYVTHQVTFAYSHYGAPDMASQTVHSDYVNYYNTGKYPAPDTGKSDTFTGKKTLVTKGKTYAGAVNTRGDLWDDDGVKLTDGDIPSADGNTGKYYGADFEKSAGIVLDLGEKIENLAEFRAYAAFGNWGIPAPESVTYYVSDDQKVWTKAGAMQTYQAVPLETQNGWTLMDYRYIPEKAVSGRFIKFEIALSGPLWLSEICAFTYETEN